MLDFGQSQWKGIKTAIQESHIWPIWCPFGPTKVESYAPVYAADKIARNEDVLSAESC